MVQLANLNTVLSLESQSFLTGIEQSRGSLRKLLESLDPTAKATARFNRDVAELDRGLKNGNLTVAEYDRAMALLRQRFESLTPNIDRVTDNVNRQRAAMQQLGFQLNDISSGLVSGVAPMQVFAQQASQVVQAVQLMNTSTTGFLGFLAGPWGAVLTAGAVALVGLASATSKTANATDDSTSATKSNEQAILELNEVLQRQTQTEVQARKAVLDHAIAQRETEIRTRSRTKAILEQVQAELQLQQVQATAIGPRGELASLGAAESSNRAAGLQAQLKAQDIAIDRAKQNITLQTRRYNEAVADEAAKTERATSVARRKVAVDREATAAIHDRARALKDAQAAMAAEIESLQRTLDRLFPGRSELRDASADLANLQTLYEQAKISAGEYADAYTRTAGRIDDANARIEASQTDLASSATKTRDQLNFVNDDLEKRFGKTAKKAQDASETIIESYARMAQGVAGSLRNLVNDIENGDILGVLDSVLSVVQGLFAPGPNGGKSILGVLGLSKRAEGGPVTGGQPYLIGERGPELFLPNQSGSVMSHEALRRSLGSGGTTVKVVPSQYFDVVVENRASGVVQRAAPGIALAGASGGVQTLDRRRDRSLV